MLVCLSSGDERIHHSPRKNTSLVASDSVGKSCSVRARGAPDGPGGGPRLLTRFGPTLKHLRRSSCAHFGACSPTALRRPTQAIAAHGPNLFELSRASKDALALSSANHCSKYHHSTATNTVINIRILLPSELCRGYQRITVAAAAADQPRWGGHPPRQNARPRQE